MKTIRLGVVGHGLRISGLIKKCWRTVEPDFRVTGIVDPDEKGARLRLDERDRQDVVFYRTLDEMVRKGRLDALVIGTRCKLHAPYAIQASRYDIPLYLEKPVATSMQQAVALEKAFKKSRCPVVVSFPLRVSQLCTMTRQLIEEGAVGTPEHIAAVNYVPYGTCYWDNGYHYKISQGLFLQKATHDFDYMSFLMGSSIVRVAAMASYGRVFGGKKPAGLMCSKCGEKDRCLESPQNRKRNASGDSQGDHLCVFSVDCGNPKTGINEDCSSALVEFASGAHGIYTQVFFTRRDAATRGATVSGYHGTVRFDWYQNEIHRVRHHTPLSDTIKAGQGLLNHHSGGDTELLYDLLDILHGKTKKSRAPIEAGIQSVYACLAAKASAKTGKFVRVRQVG